jgi:hypothetical protein
MYKLYFPSFTAALLLALLTLLRNWRQTEKFTLLLAIDGQLLTFLTQILCFICFTSTNSLLSTALLSFT